MRPELKSAYESPILWLFLRVLGAVLFLRLSGAGSFWWSAIFFAYAIYLFFYFFRNNSGLSFTFFSLIAVFWGVMGASDDSASWLLAISFGLLLFLFLGIKSLRLPHHKTAAGVVYYGLAFAVTAFFTATPFFWLRLPLLFFFFFFLARDMSKFFIREWSGRQKVYILTGALLVAELSFFAALLSMGFLSSALLVLVFFIPLFDIFQNFFLGTFSRIMLWRNVGFTAFFSALIFLAHII